MVQTVTRWQQMASKRLNALGVPKQERNFTAIHGGCLPAIPCQHMGHQVTRWRHMASHGLHALGGYKKNNDALAIHRTHFATRLCTASLGWKGIPKRLLMQSAL
eukprot:Skav214168  [mRNA]  locus=scaffold945:227695:228006:- [translate_table: standard]